MKKGYWKRLGKSLAKMLWVFTKLSATLFALSFVLGLCVTVVIKTVLWLL